LFGTTGFGGSNHCGSVFKLRTNGADYTVLKELDRTEAAYAFGGLTLAGGTLFGMTHQGGAADCGTVFSLKTDGSDFTVLKEFNGSDGQRPQTRVLAAGGTLFGATPSGGDWDRGVVFSQSVDRLLNLTEPRCVGTNFTFWFQTVTNVTYTLEYTEDLESPNWFVHHTQIGDGSVQQHLIPMTNSTQRFFRVRQP
jgi:uncharacterized repeat protein (TIGR03803 family)